MAHAQSRTALPVLLSFALAAGLAALTVDVPAQAAPTPATTPTVSTPGDPVPGLRDLDARGTAAPLASQLAAVQGLGAVSARWNSFGTPASLLPASGSLGAAPGKPADAARAWLTGHASVFGLTPAQIDDLELVSAQPFAQSPARAVLFRQRIGGLVAAEGGLVTVGVAEGKVVYVSSSLVRIPEGATVPEATVSPLQGWLAAAASVGQAVPASKVSDIVSRVADGWTRLRVPGLAQEQLVRLRMLAMADGSLRPVLQANVVDVAGGAASAYTVIVDAANEKILVRRNAVDNATDQKTFTGSVTATECGPKHAFELTDDKTRQLHAIATGVVVDDFVVKIFDPAGRVLVENDVATNPEVASYTAAAIPSGTYSVQVCPFDATSVTVGRYLLAVTSSDQAAPEGGSPLAGNPKWRYFPANPTLDSPTQTPTNSVVGCWLPGAGCSEPAKGFANLAAFGPWDSLLAVPTFTTVGNNANTHEAWASPLTPGGLAQAPVSPTRDYTQEFTDEWNNSKCDPTKLVPGGNDINASVTNLFAAHNRMHDYSYYLGFTEENYNLQTDNGNRGGVPGDPEIGNAQAGGISGGGPTYLGRDNANQIALQDGVPGITNQYLFQPIAGSFYSPCTDGGLDMGIVGHEYTHAITNRMVGGPDDGLTSEQGGAMGESWGDLVAGEYMFSHGYPNGGNPWAIGVYATGNPDTAIRDYAINHNPLNYSNYGFDSTGPEVHADGEIWNGTMWEVRQALVEKYDASYSYADTALQRQCAQADRLTTPLPADRCPGNRRWVQLMFDSFLLQQGATSMLDARDAMIAADEARFNGANRNTLWEAFARRGMGKDASTPDADADEPTPSFASKTTPNTSITFTSEAPEKIYVGDYEARVTPVADTDPATSLAATVPFTPGEYRMLAVSPARGATRFTMTVKPGGATQTVRIDDNGANLAAAANGATVLAASAGSLNPGHLIDGTEGTNWGGTAPESVDDPDTHPSVTIDLAGDTPVTLRRLQVSAMLVPAPADDSPVPVAVGKADEDPDSGARFTALRKFRVETCLTDCASATATWTPAFTSGDKPFPGTLPRPVAPNLTMRSFDLPSPVDASAVRLVALENQCTGTEEYAGEQDNDPNNATDCKEASDGDLSVHAAEFQAFGTARSSTPLPGDGTTPGDPGTPPGTTPGVPGATPGTPGATPPPGGWSKILGIRISDRLQRQRHPRKAKMFITLRVKPNRAKHYGRVVVSVDGVRYRVLKLRNRKARLVLYRGLTPGRHIVETRFIPARGTSYPAGVAKPRIIRIVRR